MTHVAIFASGNGTNAENIIKYFHDKTDITISTVLTNNPKAGVIERVKSLGISVHVFNRNDFFNSNKVIEILGIYDIDFIVLSGFLWLIPENIIAKYENRILNIHPALLPKFGGKGMYGMNVHKAVINAGEKKSGITIHYVNNKYDEGQIIFQISIVVKQDDSPVDLANKIHKLEYKYFPQVIEKTIRMLTS